MKSLHDPVEIIQKDIASWETPFVEIDCFGTADAARIAAAMNEFCRIHLGSKISGYLFYGSSMGSTHGLRLQVGRDIVIKVRPPAGTNPYFSQDRASLENIFRVMHWLSDRGYPCPKPVLGPTPLGMGFATVEGLLDAGRRGNGFDSACRKLIATGLAELMDLLESFEGEVSDLYGFWKSASLYPQPHSKLFDFKNTAAGAEWIDTFAKRARAAEAHEGAPVLGHADWKVEHLRFDDGRIVATYDWDSLAIRPETELVGISAHA
ncbi:MAG: phosphotransferase, partial [Candidatus Binatia bacterium]